MGDRIDQNPAPQYRRTKTLSPPPYEHSPPNATEIILAPADANYNDSAHRHLNEKNFSSSFEKCRKMVAQLTEDLKRLVRALQDDPSSEYFQMLYSGTVSSNVVFRRFEHMRKYRYLWDRRNVELSDQQQRRDELEDAITAYIPVLDQGRSPILFSLHI